MGATEAHNLHLPYSTDNVETADRRPGGGTRHRARRDRTFTSFALPDLAQSAPIRAIIAHDVDGDGNLDLIVAGNLYDAQPNAARVDAGNGLWLKGDGHGHFTPVPAAQSGPFAPRDVTGLALMRTPAGNAVLVANHSDSLQAFTMRRP